MNEEKRSWSLLDESRFLFKPLPVLIQQHNRNVRIVEQSIDVSLKGLIANIVETDKNQIEIGQD